MKSITLKRIIALVLCISMVLPSFFNVYADSIPEKYLYYVENGRVDYRRLHEEYFQVNDEFLIAPTSSFTVSVNGEVKGYSDSGNVLEVNAGDAVEINNTSKKGSGTALSKCDFQISDGTSIIYSTTSLGAVNLSSIPMDRDGTYNIYLNVMDNEDMEKTEGWGNWAYNGTHVAAGTNPGGGTGNDFPGWWYYSKLTIKVVSNTATADFSIDYKGSDVTDNQSRPAALDPNDKKIILEDSSSVTNSEDPITSRKWYYWNVNSGWAEISGSVNKTTVTISNMDTGLSGSGQNKAFKLEVKTGKGVSDYETHTAYFKEPEPTPPAGKGTIYVYYKDKSTGADIREPDKTTYAAKPYGTYTITAPAITGYKLDTAATPSPQTVILDANNNFREVVFLYIADNPVKPPPGNMSPIADIRGPITELAGEEVRWNGSGSFDYDGTIVSYSWTFPGAVLVKNDNERITVYYPEPGEYEVELEVTDDDGAKGYATRDITITEPYPTANIEITGIFKENRKVRIDGSGSSSPDYYPINNYAWTFSDTANMKYQGTIGSTTKTIDAIFKTVKSYTSTLKVTNTYGLSNSTSKSVTIVQDQNPNVNFTVTPTVMRDPSKSNVVTIKVNNLTTSPDGDPIKKTVVFYAYDSNNDGNFDNETWKYSTDGTTWQNVGMAYSQIKTNFDIYNISGGNPLIFTLQTNQVGRYKFEAMAIEDIPAADTIPALLSPSDYRRGDTFTSKPNSEKIVNVINVAPTVSFEVFKEKQTDIVVVTDYTGTKLANLEASLNAQKATLKAHNIDVNFTIVNTPRQVAYINDKLRWFRRYGIFRYRCSYESSSTSGREDRSFTVEIEWEAVQKLESQVETLPYRNPQNFNWTKSGPYRGSGNDREYYRYTVSCTNDIKTSDTVKVITYYDSGKSYYYKDDLEKESFYVQSDFQKEDVIQDVTTYISSIDFGSLSSVALREGSDRYALVVTDSYQKDFTQPFGSYFPFGGLTDEHMNYFLSNGFKVYVVAPPKAVDATLLEEKVVDFALSNNTTYIKTIEGTIKGVGYNSSTLQDRDIVYPKTVSTLSSIRKMVGKYVLQEDGTLKYEGSANNFANVTGISGTVKDILSDEYAITEDGSLYYLSENVATDTGLDGIESVIYPTNTYEVAGGTVAVGKNGGSYYLLDAEVKKTIHSSWKAVEFYEDYQLDIRENIAVVVMDTGYVYVLNLKTYGLSYLNYGVYNRYTDTYTCRPITDCKSFVSSRIWRKDGTMLSYFWLEYQNYTFYIDMGDNENDRIVYNDVKRVLNRGDAYVLESGTVICKIWYYDYNKEGDRRPSVKQQPINELHGKDVIGVWNYAPPSSAYDCPNGYVVLCSNGDVYFQKCDYPFELKFTNIKGVYQTQRDIVFLDKDGNLWPLDGDADKRISNVAKVQQLNNRVVILTKDYKIYGFGSTYYGQLGYVNQSNYSSSYENTTRNIYNIMVKLYQPNLSYITLREILDSRPENKLFAAGKYQDAINDITNTYLNDTTYTTNYILVNDIVNYNMIYGDYESDPMYAQEWKFIHDPYYFDNSMGLASFHGQTLSSPVTKFDKKGLYTINVRVRDNPKNDLRFKHDTNEDYNYYKWSSGNQNVLLYVHEKPIALARVSITDNGDGTYTVKAFDAGSYDPDHTSRSDKGIAEREWRWREYTQINWTYGQMNKSDCTPDKRYIIQLRVKDLEGVWSDYYTIEIRDDNPPIALFSLDKFVISTTEKLKVKDQSYTQSFSKLITWHWVVKKLNSDGTVPAANEHNGQFNNSNTGTGAMAGYDVNVKTDYSSTGKYRMYLRVKNSLGLWSDGGTDSIDPADLSKYYSLDFEVDKLPTASFTIDKNLIKPEEQLKVKDTSAAAGTSSLAKWHWMIKKFNSDGSLPGTYIFNKQFVDRNTGAGGYDINVKTLYNDTGTGKYRIYLRVMNGNGMWSDGGTNDTVNLGSCVYRDITVDSPPVASFTIANNPLDLELLLKLRDTSTKTGISDIDRWHWIVRKLNEDGSLPSSDIQNAQFNNSNAGTGELAGYDSNVKTDYRDIGIGTYRIYLRVRNANNMWSDGGTDSSYNLNNFYYQDLVVKESFKLSSFRVVKIRDFALEPYYKSGSSYIDRPMFVNDMAIDQNNFIVGGISLVPGFTGLAKGYRFEFEIDSTNFNEANDTIVITPTFYTYVSGVPGVRGPQADLYWEDSNKAIHKAGEGAHSSWKTITLNSSNRTITGTNTATWRGEYFIPATSWAVPLGTSAANAKSQKINADIIVNFTIRGYKNGAMKYDYNEKQWPVERTVNKVPYQIGDVIRYDHTRSSLDDSKVIINRP